MPYVCTWAIREVVGKVAASLSKPRTSTARPPPPTRERAALRWRTTSRRERFTRINADTINYEATIDDPVVFTRPWRVAYPLKRSPKYVIYEYACHEGNYALANLLSGSQAEQRAQENNR
jgi:hypothetical protein